MSRKKFDPRLIPKTPELHFEKSLWEQGMHFVAGIDEAGRGALAGPVYAAAVVFPRDLSLLKKLSGVRDSKVMTPSQRTIWADKVKKSALYHATGSASSKEIDQIGIIGATVLAIRRAILKLDLLPDHLLIDALTLKHIPIPQTSLIKGDARSLSIAAASILAKTARDKYMVALNQQYPGYHFKENKGYGTQIHLAAIQALGPCPFHRMSFAPMKPRLL